RNALLEHALMLVAAQVGGRRRFDHARLNAVDIDAMAGQLQGSGPNEAIEAGLRGCVVSQPWVGDAWACDGGGYDHSATTGFSEQRKRFLGEPESGLEVDRQSAIQQLGIDLLERAQGIEAGVVDEDVYTLQALARLIHQPSDGVAFGYVRLNRM